MSTKITILSEAQLSEFILDSKLVALRWDLIKSCLILDLDAPESERENAPWHRIWLVFFAMCDISWNLDNARLPHGCFLSSYGTIEEASDGFKDFSVGTLTPIFINDSEYKPYPFSQLKLRAKRIFALMSVEKAIPDQFGFERKDRNNLASDEDFLEVALKVVGSEG